MTFYVSASVGVIIKAILQNARCNNKDKEQKMFANCLLLNYVHII